MVTFHLPIVYGEKEGDVKQIDLVQIRELAAERKRRTGGSASFSRDRIWTRTILTTASPRLPNVYGLELAAPPAPTVVAKAQPTFSEEDVRRVARRLDMDRQQFIDTYIQKTEHGESNPWETRTTPCPFLKGNLCSIYEDRPGDCSDYPHLYKPDFISRTWGTIERTFTCPIVYEVMEELKKSLRSEWRAYKRK